MGVVSKELRVLECSGSHREDVTNYDIQLKF